MLYQGTTTNYDPSMSIGTNEIQTDLETTTEHDNSNAFEGPEKLLEVWFAPAPNALPAGVETGGLKAVGIETWKEMLNLVNCKILSVVESEHIDAYLLSESSMFIFPHKLILKTCGTTTLLLGLSRILNIAAVDAGFPKSEDRTSNEASAIPYRVFYSRKKFLYPDRQQGPHRCWENEVEFLDGIFERGSAYMVGKMNGDHWYLYLTSPNTSIITSKSEFFLNQHNSSLIESPGRNNDDETLEILMSDLDQENAKQFYVDYIRRLAATKASKKTQYAQRNNVFDPFARNGKFNSIKFGASPNVEKRQLHSQSTPSGFLTPPKETFDEDDIAQGHALGAVVTETCGLLDVFPAAKYPHARVDSYLFSPCGYSVNGVIPAIDSLSAHYFTVHVTPEPQCSYASFEANVPIRGTGRDTAAVVEQVVGIFKPGRFSVTIFEAKSESGEDLHNLSLQGNKLEISQFRKPHSVKLDMLKGYRRTDQIIHEFDGYDLVFRYYEREG